MVKLTVASNYSFDINDIDFSNLYYGTSYTRSSTLFKVTYSGGTVDEFRGTGFSYDAYGEPVGGTVTSYAMFYGGQRLFLVEGASVAATSIAAAAQTYSIDDDFDVIINALRGNDTLTGGNLADVMMGFGGNDILNGNGGADNLYGYDGNDTIIGGAGGDSIDGGVGSDSASYAGATRGVTAHLASPSVNTNDAAGDTYNSIENFVGSSYADRLFGNSGANMLLGATGNDLLSGNAGNDYIVGGAGADQLYGGLGADKFVFKTPSESIGVNGDTIFDFLPATGDRIDLSAIDASTKVAGDQAFTFVGTAAFRGVAGDLRYVKQASDTYVYGDVNGDKVADFKIRLDEAVTLTKDYFIL
ncbi:calcium-binding protein [Sinorhizobium fredii]|uniref:calcium-binding protein n=1 Tax=Rhizobium fredii TaxID=380 RepID=UPI0004AD1CB9|nr:hypothetical protein [Sinorhizobium fredii]